MQNRTNGSEPLISVVLCTYNRADLLDTALKSLLGQNFPRADFEILVVDNASTDNTRQTIAPYESTGLVRYICEPNVGLSNARNTGWRAARGRLVAYIDDDSIPVPGWLGAIQAASAAYPLDVGMIGGRVEPMWERPRPSWLADEIAYSLTIVDWGDEPKFIDDLTREWLAGANMVIPKHILEEVGGFHPGLARVGTLLLSNEDVFLQKELLKRGYRCLYWPDAAVQHLVPAARLAPQWFLRRYYWQGFSDAAVLVLEQSPDRADRHEMALSRNRWLQGRASRLSWPLAEPKNPREFSDACFAFRDAGFIAGLLGTAVD